MTPAPSYDDMRAAGWEHHRNGVSGLPFWVQSDGKVLEVAFMGFDDNAAEALHDPISVPLDVIRLIANRPVDEHGLYGIGGDRVIVAVFNDGDDPRPMVALLPLDLPPEDCPIAVFSVNELPDVRFGYNSMRGDRFLPTVLDHVKRTAPSVRS